MKKNLIAKICVVICALSMIAALSCAGGTGAPSPVSLGNNMGGEISSMKSATQVHHDQVSALSSISGVAAIEQDYQIKMSVKMDSMVNDMLKMDECEIEDMGRKSLDELVGHVAEERNEMAHHSVVIQGSRNMNEVMQEEDRHLAAMDVNLYLMSSHKDEIMQFTNMSMMCNQVRDAGMMDSGHSKDSGDDDGGEKKDSGHEDGGD